MSDWFTEGGRGAPCDVGAILDGAGGETLQELVGVGALVSLGLTSDGGALGVTVTVDGRWRREYFRDGEELRDWLAEALPAVRAAVEAGSASSGRDNASRRRRGR